MSTYVEFICRFVLLLFITKEIIF